MTMEERVQDAIENLSNTKAVALWNRYCEETTNMDDYVYEMGQFNEVMSGREPWDIARTCYYSGKFCPMHDYFWFNGYGNLESSDLPSLDSPIDSRYVAEWITDHGNALECDDIREILDKEGE